MSSNRERSTYNADKKRKFKDKQRYSGDYENSRHLTIKTKKSFEKDKSTKYKRYDTDEDI